VAAVAGELRLPMDRMHEERRGRRSSCGSRHPLRDRAETDAQPEASERES
jgi:hypothetical protein